MDGNRYKSNHGKKGKEQLYDLLDNYKGNGSIKEVQTPYKVGYEGKKENQFYFQSLMTFEDEKWLLQSTTSIRSDRINIQQWNAFHMKNINQDITRAIIVYPDSIDNEEQAICKRYNELISSGVLYSAIDDVISLRELDILLENKNIESLDLGDATSRLGTNLEARLTRLLNNESNRMKWNGKNIHEVGNLYPYFEQIMSLFEIRSEKKIAYIRATDQIPLLPSGGKPKTDVAVTIRLEGEKEENLYTLSLKRTSSKWVSVHQFPAQQFIKVLGITNNDLKNALLEFQRVGNIRDMQGNSREILEQQMPKYNEYLVRWAYSGVIDGTKDIRNAQFIGVYKNDTEELEFWTLEQYVQEILKIGGNFGTSFRWTYKSKQRGSSIQLKGKIL